MKNLDNFDNTWKEFMSLRCSLLFDDPSNDDKTDLLVQWKKRKEKETVREP